MNIENSNRVRVRENQFSLGELNDIYLQDTQPILVQRRKRTPKRRYVLLGMLLFLFLAGSILSGVGYQMYQTYNARYQTDLSFARTGVQHLQKVESLLATWSKKPLDTQITNQAEIEFASAFKNFELLHNDLAALPGLVKQVPVYGARLNSALRLVPLAMTLSQAGITGCSILNTLATGLHDPLSPKAHGITQTDLAVVNQGVKELQSALQLATQQVNQLQPSDLQFDSRLPKLVGTFHKDLPAIQGWINTIQQLLPVAPTLLGIGTPTNYLIEMLDSTELRPGGGFIGNYGIMTLSGGRLADVHITDIDLIDKPFEFAGNTIPYPVAYTWFDLAPGSWSFRDSNLDADFSTAARYGEQTYTREGGKVPVQGVIAITPALIEHAIAITGPIAVPEYHETVTAQNLIARIHYHQLGGKAAGEGSELIPAPDGHSSLRKRFTAYLAEHFFARVHQLSRSSSTLPKFFQLLVSALHTKDIQIYLNSGAGENLLHRYHIDAGIQAPVGDSLFVVDANISPNKANDFIIYKLHDQVVIDAAGNAIHRTTLSYDWSVNGRNYGSPVYRDYVRVYAPPGSTLQAQIGWEPRGTARAFGREVWAGLFTLSYGQSRVITLTWTVRNAAQRDVHGWHYQYLLQKQAGDQWIVDLQVTLPACAVIEKSSGGLVTRARKTATLTRLLSEDLSLGIDYNC